MRSPGGGEWSNNHYLKWSRGLRGSRQAGGGKVLSRSTLCLVDYVAEHPHDVTDLLFADHCQASAAALHGRPVLGIALPGLADRFAEHLIKTNLRIFFSGLLDRGWDHGDCFVGQSYEHGFVISHRAAVQELDFVADLSDCRCAYDLLSVHFYLLVWYALIIP